MYDVEKRSMVLENAAGFVRCKYIQYQNKMAALGYVYSFGKQTSHSPERCMSRNATSTEFREDQIPCPRVCLGFVGTLCQALEVRKNSVEKN